METKEPTGIPKELPPEELKPDWEKVIRYVKKVKGKFERDDRLSIDEARWVLWASGIPHEDHSGFEAFIYSHGLFHTRLAWTIWSCLYAGYKLPKKTPP